MAKIGNILIIIGVLLLGFFAYEIFMQNKTQDQSLQEAAERIEAVQNEASDIQEVAKAEIAASEEEPREAGEDKAQAGETEESAKEIQGEGEVKSAALNQQNAEQQDKVQPEIQSVSFQADHMDVFAILEIPKIGKRLAVVEGADENALDKGVGHMKQTAYPGQGEQIVFAGHRDTVFRDFGELKIGDEFIVQMPYGEFKYQIRETEIVHEDDTSVVRPMGEEVLVVSTCYPFSYFGSATERFVAYAYPVS